MLIYKAWFSYHLISRHSSQACRCILSHTFSYNISTIQNRTVCNGTWTKSVVCSNYPTVSCMWFFRGLRNKGKAISDNNVISTNNISEVLHDLSMPSKPNRKPSQFAKEPPEVVSQTFTVSNVETKTEEEIASKPKSKKAFDIALKIRESNGKKKSPHHAKEQVELTPLKHAIKKLSMPDLTKMEDIDLARLIRRNVIYADKRLVVFNKPYGLSVHDGDNISQSIKSVLPMVSKMVYGVNTNVPLHLCNRLDRYTTGVTIATTDTDTSRRVMELMREHRVIKKYWVILVGIPDPAFGIVEIPIDRLTIESDGKSSHTRMVMKPLVRYDYLTGKETKTRSRGFPATTHYKMLDFSSSLSLVELQPQTTIKHQLRVHMADGLACPILGDHKYSHSNKLAPQILPPNILKRFGITRTKGRYMPMHLHLQSVLIPGIFPGYEKPNIVLGARLPAHMTRTMKLFRLKPGTATEWKGVHGRHSDMTAKPLREGYPLYYDPTVPSIEDDSTYDLDNCVKVFRKNNIRVKYKHN